MCKITLYKTMSLSFLLVIAVSCNDPSPLPQTNTPSSATIDTPIPIAQSAHLTYAVIESVPTTEAGIEFEIPSINCGSEATLINTFERERTFEVKLIRGETRSIEPRVEADILISEAELSAAIESSLGVQVGSQETVRGNLQVETLPDQRKVIKVRWDEIWVDLTVAVMDENGVVVAEVPGRVLTNISLNQLDVQETPCTLAPTPSPTPPIQSEIIGTWILSHYENTTPEFLEMLDDEGYFVLKLPFGTTCRLKPTSIQFDSRSRVERCALVETTFAGSTFGGEQCIDGTYTVEDESTVYLEIPEPQSDDTCKLTGSTDEVKVFIDGDTLRTGNAELGEVVAVYERR